MADWTFAFRALAVLPPLAWLAEVRRGDSVVRVTCGSSVRQDPAGFVDGTWVGDPGVPALPASTTVFGCGMVATADELVIVPTSYAVAGVYTFRGEETLLVSNSLTGLLVAADAELLADGAYPDRFVRTIDGIGNSPISVPTTRGEFLYHWFWNISVAVDLSTSRLPKPREEPFATYADYRARLSAALRSAMSNAPGYAPVVTVSTGYDSTAVAVIAAENGCSRAVTFGRARATRKTGFVEEPDSGAATAARLGMEATEYERLAYLARDDFPEAEFLAPGSSGEDVVMSSFEPALARSLLITGTQGNGMWRRGGNRRNDLSRSALDGTSLSEFRMRLDCMFVPLPVFGATQRMSLMDVSGSEEMRAWRVRGRYDQPIARRIAEDAGIPRGTFAVHKRAGSALLHTDGAAAFSPASLRSIGEFAISSGATLEFAPRYEPGFVHRLVLKYAAPLRLERFVGGLKRRRRRLVHFEPGVGTLLLRWAESVIRPRYEAFRGTGR